MNGVCVVHVDRHEFTPDCVQFDGSEEKRLREEVAEQTGAKEAAYQKLYAATARATAAESALAEARGALRDAWKIAGESIGDVRMEWSRLGDTIDATADRFRAALARAGEQETPAASWCGKPGCAEHATPPPGEQGKGADPVGRKVADLLGRAYVANPREGEPGDAETYPVEQGKGGGEGLEAELVRRMTAAMREADRAFENSGGSTRHHVRDCLLPILEKHGLRLVPLAPAQPAEHPAKCGSRSRWGHVCDQEAGHEGDHSLGRGTIQWDAEHPASGGEKCMRCGGDLSKCGHGPLTPAPGAGEQEGET